jgi:hypothetical protein
MEEMYIEDIDTINSFDVPNTKNMSTRAETAETTDTTETTETTEPKLNKVSSTQEYVPAETVEITEKEKVLPYVKPQEVKYWHFELNKQDNDKLTELFKNIPEHDITVEYGTSKSSPDISLIEDNNVVGKIHLLLCDRRDKNQTEKYYCKLYFYHFMDQKLFNIVKMKLTYFFENFKPYRISSIINGGGKIKKRTLTLNTKKKRINRRKKTIKRK